MHVLMVVVSLKFERTNAERMGKYEICGLALAAEPPSGPTS